MDSMHNLDPKTGDTFYMNLPQHLFHNPEGMAAFLRKKDAVDSASGWSDEDGKPWLVLEVRVARTIRQK